LNLDHSAPLLSDSSTSHPIFQFIHSNLYQDQLISFIKLFHPRSSFTFYTDGSVQHIGTLNINAGIIWTKTSTVLLSQFQTAVETYWISSTKTELMAIIAAIITVSASSQVDIYTDSKLVIDKFSCLNSYYSSYFHYSRLMFKDSYSDL